MSDAAFPYSSTEARRSESDHNWPIRLAAVLTWVASAALAVLAVYPIALIAIGIGQLWEKPPVATPLIWIFMLIPAGWLTLRIKRWLAPAFYGPIHDWLPEQMFFGPAINDVLNCHRTILVAASSMILISEIMTAWLERQGIDLTWMSASVAGTAITIAFLVAIGLWVSGSRLFKATRGRHIRRRHSHRPDGLSIIDFTPAWDNDRTRMLSECRGSRDLARAHFTLTLATTAAFAIAGLLATQFAGRSWAAEVTVFLAIAGILGLWPTSTRFAFWCRRVVGVSLDD
ncbi:hypothetical protein [Crateriforma conspicua]|uniref:Uncharacterized protein n=1 Tax=Crateriforma conspicua TaxID=2527996 RepID=A0A5C6G0E7_9PLAN|nr:hypothetical protein [Crateriforma conspicua]TWU67365.1 hypothetical protein V7x_29390 [Crateriforma conspicua]